MSLLVAHAALQKHFNVTVYSDTPDSNDVYPVNDTRVETLENQIAMLMTIVQNMGGGNVELF